MIIDDPYGLPRSNQERMRDLVGILTQSIEPRTTLDLRAEFDTLLQEHGHWVIFRKFDTSRYSQYFDPTTGETKNGPKYEYVDTLIKAMHSLNRPRIYNEIALPIGSVDANSNVYYLRYDVNPSNVDLIIEIDKPTGTRPTTYKVVQALNIKQVEPMRDVQGRVEFYHVLVQHMSPSGDETLK